MNGNGLVLPKEGLCLNAHEVEKQRGLKGQTMRRQGRVCIHWTLINLG